MGAVAWVLNLSADLELANPSAWVPSAGMRQQLQQFLPEALKLLGPEDQLIQPDAPFPPALRGAPGRAFCPTPSALSLLTQAGTKPEPAPSMEVLRLANHRHFGLALGAGTPGARFITTAEDLSHTLGESAQRPWLFKKPFGFAGRGQRRITRALSADDARWFTAALRTGVWAEPLVEIECEFSVHGYVSEAKSWVLGSVCVQLVDRYRAWQSSAVASAAEVEEYQLGSVLAAAGSVATALGTIGYFGPFGIDAFAWRDGHGRHFNALSEINARYTMGWAVGMAKVARDAGGLPLFPP